MQNSSLPINIQNSILHVENLLEKNYVDKNSLIIIESDRSFDEDFQKLKLIDSRIFGISKISFYILL